MGEIALAAAASHAPGITGWFAKADETMRDNVRRAYEELGERVLAARLDALVLIGNDHVLNFPVTNSPDFCIGIAPVHEGPEEWFRPWLRVPVYRIEGAPDIGAELYRGLVACRVDAAKTAVRRENFLFDDNVSVPMTMMRLTTSDIRLVPIIQNCVVPPVADQHRSYAWGQALGRVIAHRLPRGTRIGLLGSGGMSHEPGGRNYLKIDEDFDRRFLDLLVDGSHEDVLAETTYEAMEAAGSGGTSELLSWIAVMGAIGERPCEVLCYEPVAEWRCGIGAVQWQV